MATLHFFGHSCWLLKQEKTALLFDPFLTGNPFQIIKADEVDCTHILLSHGHGDHLGDTISIAKRTGAMVVSTFEVANFCAEQGCKVHEMHLGGKHAFDFGYVRVTLALHGAGVPGGHACGFVVDFFGHKVYFAGDTALFGDMSLIGRFEKLDYAILPIGDNYTMGPEDAAEAANLLQPKCVIPMHYNTMPLIAQDAQAFKQDVEKRFHIPVRIVEPGEIVQL